MPIPNPSTLPQSRSSSSGRKPRNKRKSSTTSSLRVLLWFFVALYLLLQLGLLPPPEIDDWSFLRIEGPPDAYFNNLPVRLREISTSQRRRPFRSSVHCVGETHDPATAWKHRSCKYVHLCLDLGGDEELPEFFVVASEAELDFQRRFRREQHVRRNSPYRYASTELLGNLNPADGGAAPNAPEAPPAPISVALGGINPLWKAPPSTHVPYQWGIDKIRWAPKVYAKMPTDKYYELEDDVVMIPYHSFAAHNVGHLLWDDLFPIFNLLRIFGYETATANNTQPASAGAASLGSSYKRLLVRVDTTAHLFGSCDLRPRKQEACQRNTERFLPLLGVDPSTFATLTASKLTTTKATSPGETVRAADRYPVCAKRAVTGLGHLTDHGTRNHGWMANREEVSLDVAPARNVGRGPEAYAFRTAMLHNLGLVPEFPLRKSQPRRFRILLNAHSSNHFDRDLGLEEQAKALAEAFPHTPLQIVELAKLPLVEQLALLSNNPAPGAQSQPRHHAGNTHTILVSACGGGSVTAMFLPRGSSLVLYYNEVGGMDYFANENKTGGPALLDWDFVNNLGYLRVHWLPIGSMGQPEGLESLVALVRHEMDGVLNGL